MMRIKNIIVNVFMLTAINAVAQDTVAKTEAQKVKDSVKLDVRHLGKVTNVTTTTTRRVGYKKKKKEATEIKPVADSLIVKETIVKKTDSLRQEDMPIIEADKIKTE